MTVEETAESASNASPPSDRPSITRRLLLGLICLATIASIQAAIAGVGVHRPPFFDEERFKLWASNLQDHGFYGDLPTQPPAIAEFRSVGYSAYVPPGYPFFLIILRTLGGRGTAPIRAAQSILVGLTVLAAGYTAFRLFGPIAAVLCEILLIATGSLATYAEFTLSEILSGATLLACVLLATIGIQRKSWRLLLGSGISLGVSALVRPQVWLLPIGIALFIFLFMGRRKTALLLAGVFLVGSFGTIAPWTVRNAVRLHAFVPVSTYTWINFWLVNNEKADGNFRLPEKYIGIVRVREIRALPEVEQDNTWRRMALKWVRAHPGAAVKGWIRNARKYVSDRDPLVYRWYGLSGLRVPHLDDRYLFPFVALSIVAAAFARRFGVALGLPVIVLLYFLVFFAFFEPTARFRVPLVPVMAILAAGAPEMVLAVRARMKNPLSAGT